MKKIIIYMLIAVVALSFFTGCNDNSKTFDTQTFANIGVTGLNGQGSISISLNADYVNTVSEVLTKEKNVQEALAVVKAINTLNFEIVSDKQENFSNGDEIKITATYSEAEAKNAKTTFSNTDFTYIVEGLEEGIYVDPFDEIELVYEGASPSAKVEVYNRSEKQFIRDIRYEVEPSRDLSIGDKITVTAVLNTENAKSNGFIFPDNLTKEYTIENIDEYVKDFNEIGQDGNDKMIKEATDRIESACAGHYGSIMSPLDLLSVGVSSSQIKFGEPELVDIYFNTLKPGTDNKSHNVIFYVYKISAIASELTEPRIVYAATYFSNVVKEANGTININLDQHRDNPIISSGKELDVVYSQVVTAQKSWYETQEITP